MKAHTEPAAANSCVWGLVALSSRRGGLFQCQRPEHAGHHSRRRGKDSLSRLTSRVPFFGLTTFFWAWSMVAAHTTEQFFLFLGRGAQEVRRVRFVGTKWKPTLCLGPISDVPLKPYLELRSLEAITKRIPKKGLILCSLGRGLVFCFYSLGLQIWASISQTLRGIHFSEPQSLFLWVAPDFSPCQARSLGTLLRPMRLRRLHRGFLARADIDQDWRCV